MSEGSAERDHGHRARAVMREEERVMPLELFFDLVFVLALTQCTAYWADNLTGEGFAQGFLILGVLWWSWVGYAWLTSVVNPEEGIVRISIFGAMAAFMVAALCIPEAFGENAALFAGAYGVVRVAHIALFLTASRDDPDLRKSVIGLAISTAIGVGLLMAAAATDGTLQIALWAAALALDAGGPFLFGAEGWKLVPGHFAERHALIVIVALGESIVAVGVGVTGAVDAGIVLAATLGIALAAALWWLYFDFVALVAERRLANAEAGRERNEVARDSYSYLHFPMVAGIVLVALGMKKTLEHVDDPLKLIPAAAVLGGVALYLLAHVAFRYRTIGRLSWHRLAAAAAAGALLPVALEVPAVVTVAILVVLLSVLIVYETIRFAELRDRLRHQIERERPAE